MELEIAHARTPTVLTSLVLANAGSRGDTIPEIVAPEHGFFVISLDVPTTEDFSNYRCSLNTPDGATLWETTISPEQARNATFIHMPTDKTKEGLNVFFCPRSKDRWYAERPRQVQVSSQNSKIIKFPGAVMDASKNRVFYFHANASPIGGHFTKPKETIVWFWSPRWLRVSVSWRSRNLSFDRGWRWDVPITAL
jgi:hypothetical protein